MTWTGLPIGVGNDLQSVAMLQAFDAAYMDRHHVRPRPLLPPIFSSTVGMDYVRAGVEYGLRVRQRGLVGICPGFHNTITNTLPGVANQSFDGLGACWNEASFLAALPHGGFRRKYRSGASTINTTGYIQPGDIYGPWLIEDLFTGLALLTKALYSQVFPTGPMGQVRTYKLFSHVPYVPSDDLFRRVQRFRQEYHSSDEDAHDIGNPRFPTVDPMDYSGIEGDFDNPSIPNNAGASSDFEEGICARDLWGWYYESGGIFRLNWYTFLIYSPARTMYFGIDSKFAGAACTTWHWFGRHRFGATNSQADNGGLPINVDAWTAVSGELEAVTDEDEIEAYQDSLPPTIDTPASLLRAPFPFTTRARPGWNTETLAAVREEAWQGQDYIRGFSRTNSAVAWTLVDYSEHFDYV